MDPEKRDAILKQLYADVDFAALNDSSNGSSGSGSQRIRAQLEYILVKHFDCPASVLTDEAKETDEGQNSTTKPDLLLGKARDAWLQNLLATVEERLHAWNASANLKSYTTAKKLRATARKTLELLGKLTSGNSGSKIEPPEPAEVRSYLRRAERHLSKAILQAPYAPSEAVIDREVDRLTALKFSLYGERAEVRLRLGLTRAAASDAWMALAAAETLLEGGGSKLLLASPLITAGCHEDVKVTGVRCLAALGMLEPLGVTEEELIECITFSKASKKLGKKKSESFDDGDDGPEVEDENQQEKAQLAASQLAELLAELHASSSNYHAQNAPTLRSSHSHAGEANVFFRYQADLEAIEIRTAVHKGRYFVAAGPIKAGAWLLVEKPYSTVVHKDYLASTCNHCLKELKELVKPAAGSEADSSADADGSSEEDEVGLGILCDFCKEARYCSVACAEVAFHAYHRHECGFLGFLLEPGPLAGVHTYRIIAKTGLEEALAAWKEAQGSSSSSGTSSLSEYLQAEALRTAGADWCSLGAADRRLLFDMSTSLAVHREAYSASWTAWHALQALDTALILLVRNPSLLKKALAEVPTSGGSAFRLLLDTFELSLEQVRRIAVNVFGKFDYSGPKKRNIATGQIFVGSLVNHSCAPNVEWSWSAGHILFKANRDIAQGEELNVTYGQTKSTPFQERQEALQHYHFLCGCRLCRADLVAGNCGGGSTGSTGGGETDGAELVARCLVCKVGPLVRAEANAGCLDCHAKSSPTEVRAAVGQLAKARASLLWQAKMLASTPASAAGSAAVSKSGKGLAKSRTLKAAVLPVLRSAEKTLRTLAYRTSVPFAGALRLLGRLYLQVGEPTAAAHLCPLAEQVEAAISTFNAHQQNKASEELTSSVAEMEDKLAALAFWTEVGRQFYLQAPASTSEEVEEEKEPDFGTAELLDQSHSSSQSSCTEQHCLKTATVRLYLRYLKLAIPYIEARTSANRGEPLKVCQLLQQPAFADAKLVYMLAEQKKAQLWAILKR